MDTSNPGYCHTKVGDITVTALNDGAFEAQTAWIAGVPGEEIEALLRSTFRSVPPRITISSFMITIGDEHILVDTGGGTSMGPAFGNQRRHLAALGIKPGDIKRILITHAHIDHVCGLIDGDGKPYYPNAEVIIHEAETGFWLDAAKEAAAPEGAKDGFGHARISLTPYQGRLRTISDGAEPIAGISALHLPGHTPGHTGWKITSGGDSLLIWGDVIHVPGVQFARPEAGMGFDTDIEMGRVSRAKALALAADSGLRIAGMHLDFPCFGHVARAGSGYAFVPEVWKPYENV